ncbi:MAG TPA: ATP-binding protein [Syntrophorhabdaceae bacterium]|nr:ATP-binding protein [Syntrophorhabdaceae bacterium]
MSQLELLGKIIEISHSNLELTSRIASILNIISADLSLDEAIVYTFDKDKRLTCRYANEKSVLFTILNRYRCHIGEGVIGSVAQKRTAQFYTRKDIPPRFGCLFYPELDDMADKYRAFSFLPLSDDSYIYGVLVACSASRESLHDSEKSLLAVLSREIGGILRSFELILSSKKRISELAMLSELGKVLISNAEPYELLKNLALIIAKSLNAGFVTVRLEYTPLKLGSQRFTYGTLDSAVLGRLEGLEQLAIQQLRAVSSRNSGGEEFDNGMGFDLFSAPIASKGRVLGTVAMGAERNAQPYSFEEDGQYIIGTIANYISSGLENTLLNLRLRDVVRELTEAQKRLIEQEKFRSLGEMTANIAHEIKNPLVIIGGFAKRLAKKMHGGQAESKYLDIILKEVARLETILNEILHYVKDSPSISETCNMNDFLDEILYLLSTDVSWEHVRIVKIFDSALPPVPCDSQQLKQVFINILMNAYEAMNGKGQLTIETGQTRHEGLHFARVSITDTGGGINPSIVENIFNPFFTTKEKGTGLGLAISNKIVTNHNGHIDIENTVGKGVTFIVHLPLKNLSREELI